jgi:hypothetical protein
MLTATPAYTNATKRECEAASNAEPSAFTTKPNVQARRHPSRESVENAAGRQLFP